MMKKVYTSAIVIIPPPDCFPQIQEIRSKHDKSYERWMPHINLVYPFYEDVHFEEEAKKVEKALGRIERFKLRFSKFGYFQHSASSFTLWCSPDDEDNNVLNQSVLNVAAMLHNVYPDCRDLIREGSFKPHLTLGQFKSKVAIEKFIENLSATWSTLLFDVRHIYMISRIGNEPFYVRKAIPLGSLIYSGSAIPPSINNAIGNEADSNIPPPLPDADFKEIPLPDRDPNFVAIFISNVDFSISDNESFGRAVRELAENVPYPFPVTGPVLILDKYTKKSRGFGYFQVENKDVASALSLHGAILAGRPIRVNLAK